MNIGKTMKKIREAQGVSRKDLSEHLGMTESGLWKIENNKVMPKHKTILAFCKYTATPIARLFVESIEDQDWIAPVWF